jgi:hypothetical protein
MMRKPHPARRARLITFGVSVTTFISIAVSMTVNAKQADLAASELNVATTPIELVTPTSVPTVPQTPAATPKATQPAPAKTSQPTKKQPKAKKTAAPATPSKSSAPAATPTKPAATVVYTCMSPGGKTETPTSKGKCKNAKYGYVLTKI